MSEIQVLPPEEARKIAAGEVIDRPASLVREFMDNAIDAGALNIDVSIEKGGILCAEVSDDGSGMSCNDLALCRLTHATSKIRGLSDLEKLSTLGFRGEALAAAAAVARLEIVTSCDGHEAWRLSTGPAGGTAEENCRPEPARRTRGSTVRAKRLFDTIPARKRFLKREGSEAALCLQTFIDKALPFPKINFRFLQDGKLKLFLPAAPLKERFAAAVLDSARDDGAGGAAPFLHESAATGKGFSAKIIVGGPDLYRNDRRRQYIFANGRRINDFSLLQALEYGSQGCFPNGVHPIGAIFLEIDPARADFNIHPAKREARFADSAAIHHEITGVLRSFFRHILLSGHKSANFQYDVANTLSDELAFEVHGQTPTGFPRRLERWGRLENSAADFGTNAAGSAALERILSGEYEFAPLPGRGRETSSSGCAAVPNSKLRYAGRAFNLFIMVEDGEKLYLIDQHAAHERILYDRFLSEPIIKQDLLVPITFSTESADDDEFLKLNKTELEKLGIEIEGGQGSWRIEVLPALWRLSDGETVKEILKLRSAGENIAERWAATLACHAAVRDGDNLDDEAALALAERALALPIRRCPHGRPILAEIKQSDILKTVRRTS
ncbi:MAG: DNA mismatch repair endonuclease MutL [Spirochaetaceae bacterium]|jgi:DNA mismatch repair protein MutL|nr:DNA mismatch repair endonuclease MutL [Spirochaetaceae bacterium]